MAYIIPVFESVPGFTGSKVGLGYLVLRCNKRSRLFGVRVLQPAVRIRNAPSEVVVRNGVVASHRRIRPLGHLGNACGKETTPWKTSSDNGGTEGGGGGGGAAKEKKRRSAEHVGHRWLILRMRNNSEMRGLRADFKKCSDRRSAAARSSGQIIKESFFHYSFNRGGRTLLLHRSK